MSAPAAAAPVPGRPGPPHRPRLSVVHPTGPPAHEDPVARVVVPVLADLVFPARRWQIVAEADFWGASGPVRHLITGLPEGCYRDLETVLDVLRMLAGRRARPA